MAFPNCHLSLLRQYPRHYMRNVPSFFVLPSVSVVPFNVNVYLLTLILVLPNHS